MGVVGQTNEPAPRYFVGETQTEPSLETFASMQRSQEQECRDVVSEFLAVPATEITAEDLGLPWPYPLFIGLAP